MAAGELSDLEKQRLNVTIAEVEALTGIEVCVVVRSQVETDARREAERLFHGLGMHQRPSLMIMVVPHLRSLEVLTAQGLSGRLSNEQCDRAVKVMTELFAGDDIPGGLEQGLLALADFIGPRTDGRFDHGGGQDIPNVVEVDDVDDIDRMGDPG